MSKTTLALAISLPVGGVLVAGAVGLLWWTVARAAHRGRSSPPRAAQPRPAPAGPASRRAGAPAQLSEASRLAAANALLMAPTTKVGSHAARVRM